VAQAKGLVKRRVKTIVTAWHEWNWNVASRLGPVAERTTSAVSYVEKEAAMNSELGGRKYLASGSGGRRRAAASESGATVEEEASQPRRQESQVGWLNPVA
jgi:hypothetical protein